MFDTGSDSSRARRPWQAMTATPPPPPAELAFYRVLLAPFLLTGARGPA